MSENQMSELPRPRFNIIYTPGTVRYLQLFVFSLLKWLDCSSYLVSNGCSYREKRLLRALCHQSPRLEFLALDVKKPIRHGEALTHLQSLERSGTFCFMDSDILATGDFLSDLAPHLKQHAGVFSGSPLWCLKEDTILPETFPGMGGRFNETDKGVCIGNTYFAMYDNKILTSVIKETGIGFERRSWSDIPVQYQGQLDRMNFKKERYDTGKLLNLMLLIRGEQLLFMESPHLHHIGGVSAYHILERRIASGQRRKRLTRWLPEKLKRPIKRWFPEDESYPKSYRLDEEERQRRIQRIHTSSYFSRLLQALFENQPLPAMPSIEDAEIARALETATKHILELDREFGGRLIR